MYSFDMTIAMPLYRKFLITNGAAKRFLSLMNSWSVVIQVLLCFTRQVTMVTLIRFLSLFAHFDFFFQNFFVVWSSFFPIYQFLVINCWYSNSKDYEFIWIGMCLRLLLIVFLSTLYYNCKFLLTVLKISTFKNKHISQPTSGIYLV